MSNGFLPYGKQYIDDADVAAVASALRDDYLTTGPKVAEFERAFTEAVGAQHAVACVNGTAALHLTALALDLVPGDWVVVPAITFLATANAARYCGADVVFADVDPLTGLMRAQDVEDAVARAPKPPKVVYPVHLGGPCCDLPGIVNVADRHGLDVVEDACHALGTTGRIGNADFRVGDGRWSRMAMFSTHPVKMMTTGEGGLVVTNDGALAQRLERLRSHGMTRVPNELTLHDQAFAASGAVNRWYYEMNEIGFNYRITDLQCALGLSQLRKLDRFVVRRRELVARYLQLFADAAIPHVTMIPADGRLDIGWHLFRVRIDFAAAGRDRNEVMAGLAARGIGSQVHYVPLYRQPYYMRRYGQIRLPGAEAYYSTTLSLPLFFGMADSDVDRVVAALGDVLQGNPP